MTDPLAYENGMKGDRQMDVYECIAQVEQDALAAVAAAADKAAESHDWSGWNEDSLTLESYLNHRDTGEDEDAWRDEPLPDDDDFTFLPADYDRLEV